MTEIKYITIIDDDPITIFGIKKMLSLTVHCEAVESFSNGKLALDNIMNKLKGKEVLPEIIFLDINMPIMDGWEFLEEFTQLPIDKKVRINIVTSSIDPYDREKWEYYKDRTHHLITFNTKPIRRHDIQEITKVA